MDNLLGEFVGTMVLIVFGCGVSANLTLEKSKAQNAGWICTVFGWGFAVMLGVFTATTLSAPTGYAMSPARDLGPRIAHAVLPIAGKGSSDWGYAWIPVIAPLCGSALAYVVVSALGAV